VGSLHVLCFLEDIRILDLEHNDRQTFCENCKLRILPSARPAHVCTVPDQAVAQYYFEVPRTVVLLKTEENDSCCLNHCLEGYYYLL
jgi:hypothetical protein